MVEGVQYGGKRAVQINQTISTEDWHTLSMEVVHLQYGGQCALEDYKNCLEVSGGCVHTGERSSQTISLPR